MIEIVEEFRTKRGVLAHAEMSEQRHKTLARSVMRKKNSDDPCGEPTFACIISKDLLPALNMRVVTTFLQTGRKKGDD